LNVTQLTMTNWRGFEHQVLQPHGHVLLAGEPRAGRSSVLTALHRVLDPEATRTVEEFDFYRGDLTRDILIDVVLGALPADLQHRFLDQLEFWNPETRQVQDDLDDPGGLVGSEPILRLTYRARWDVDGGRAEQVVFWTKNSDPTSDELRRVSRADRERLPFTSLAPGKPLTLAPRGGFRALLDAEDLPGVAAALETLAAGVTDLSADLSAAPPVPTSLARVFEPLLYYLELDADSISDLVRFLPDGGSLSALLRSLEPALDLKDGAGALPLRRHGSTAVAQVATSEVLATAGLSQAVVVLDDFGDVLDTASAERLAALLRRSAGQVWLSTRRPEAARSFDIDELVRLVRPRPASGGVTPMQRIFYGRQAVSKSERIAARELHRQLLPAMTARAVIVVEGPHDLAAFSALADRLDYEDRIVPPAAFGIRLIDAGEGDGGIDAVPRVCALARSLGLRAVAIIDFDNDVAVANDRLTKVQAAADAVVRPPHKVGIERALLQGLPEADLVQTLQDLSNAYTLTSLPAGWQTLSGPPLLEAARIALKKTVGGLHTQFIAALPPSVEPPIASAALRAAIDLSRGARPEDLVQL
jgi:putative ATP-dependent endonuclease of OLD family